MKAKLKYSEIGIFKDTYIDKAYFLVRAKASDVSKYLKANLKAKGIDYEQFNMHRDMDGETKEPPTEIYEYQNFFLMERADGEHILLDGFRRLLYCTPPDHDIYIRIYQENGFTRAQIMKMMVYLNHFKFYGISNYYDRGFALTMFLLYGINIPEFRKLFDSFLRDEDENSFYNSTSTSKGKSAIRDVSELMTDPLFVDNMQFLHAFSKTNQMANRFFAIQFREFMEKYQKPITVPEFLAKLEGNKILDELLEKYKKVGTSNSSDSTKVVRQITEIYEAAFNSFLGIEAEKTYPELVKEMKDHVAQLKKDKTLVKLTKLKNYHEVFPKLVKAAEKGTPLEFVFVVHPYDDLTFGRDREKQLPAEPGLYTSTSCEVAESGNGLYRKKYVKVFLMDGDRKKASIKVSYGSYGSSTKSYEELEGEYEYFKEVSKYRVPNMKVDLFVKI